MAHIFISSSSRDRRPSSVDKGAAARPSAAPAAPAQRSGTKDRFTWPTATPSAFERMPLLAIRTIGEGMMVVLAISVVIVLAWAVAMLLSGIL